MDQKDMFRQMLDFSKTAFDNTFTSMLTIQDQIESVGSKMLDQASWLPPEGKKALTEWIRTCKQARDDFKKTVDENYKRVEEFFSTAA